MKSERPNRSDHYQWKINEVPVDHGFLGIFEMHRDKLSEEVKEINDQIMERIMQLIQENGTPTQRQAVTLLLEGNTQQEVNKILHPESTKLSNSNIAKVLHGGRMYVNGIKGNMCGGVGKKIMASGRVDETIQKLMLQLSEHEHKGAMYRLVSSWFEDEEKLNVWMNNSLPIKVDLKEKRVITEARRQKQKTYQKLYQARKKHERKNAAVQQSPASIQRNRSHG